MMNKNKVLEGDDQLLSSDVPLIAYLFQTKVMFLLKIMLIYDKPLLCGQPQLSSHLLVLGGRGGGVAAQWRFNCTLRACLHGVGSPHLSYKCVQIKMRDYVDRQVIHQSRLPHLPGVPHLPVNRP